MKKRAIKFISVLFITSSLLVALFPFSFSVLADNATYYELTTDFYNMGLYDGDRPIYVRGSKPMRSVVITYPDGNNTQVIIGYVCTTSATGYYKERINGDVSTISMMQRNNYYVGYYSAGYLSRWTSFNVPVVSLNYTLSGWQPYDVCIDYTYGSHAVDPGPPPPTYGDIIVDGYKTDIAGQGEASLGNIDHILWNNSTDTLGNDISNLKVRLQIVPGTYYGDSKAQLLSKTYEDLILNINSAHDQLYDVSLGEVSFNWSDIVNWLNITPYKLWSAQLFGVNWEKEGWIYRLRLEDPDNEYVGDWQTVYSSTSSGVENDFNIINNNTIDQTFIYSLQEVNNLNSVTNSWTVNNTEISVTNNYTEPAQGDKPWWAYLLESILNTFNITNNYIYEGDSNTQNITNTVNDSDDDMNRKIGEYQQFEDSFIDNMNDNLTDIDTDVDFLSDNKFIASANWVSQQYNRMTNNTVIGSFIGFSLLFGLALIFIGKIR